MDQIRNPYRAVRVNRVAASAALLGFVGLIAAANRASSAALATLTGGGYSGVLSSNASIRQQQLICDPTGAPLSGKTSVKYDPSIVALTGLDFAPGYCGSAAVEVRGQVAVKLSNGCWGTAVKTFLQPLTSFLKCPQGQETGYVQVSYKLTGTPQEMCVAPGYKVVDTGGVNGADTHDLLFKYRSGAAATAMADYTVYADTGNRPSGNSSDYLTGVTSTGKTFTLGPSQLAPASVTGSLLSGPATNSGGDQENNGNGKGNTKDKGNGDGDGNGHGNANGGNGNSKANRAKASVLRAAVVAGADAAPSAPAANAVPLPPALWSGMATLAGIGLLGLRRRTARA